VRQKSTTCSMCSKKKRKWNNFRKNSRLGCRLLVSFGRGKSCKYPVEDQKESPLLDMVLHISVVSTLTDLIEHQA